MSLVYQDLTQVLLFHDGIRIQPEKCPDDLEEIEDNDQVDVVFVR